ncbi:uncharacterized protein LOC131425232 [Malaya genurostris]|uniref:uncharacterized protein LOC131425232 n=1 Tax=Malaya genurostris TaxID=325434 RepID=UPI0026F3ECFA|nr:uncharacterized protein LOC131425232 [Malaya genurostris]XP_058442929.1 uncharacterized protein LOC131425232 [Malaya genurostris]
MSNFVMLQTFGYFLANATLGSNCQARIIIEAVKHLRTAGFIPSVVVMDQHATNVQTAKALGVNTNKPMFFVDSKPVVFFYDNPHLLKSMRNNLFAKNVLYKNKIASFQHIRELFSLDVQNVPRLVPKLTRKAVFLPPFSKMSVKNATRTLSRTTASAIKFYVQLECMEAEAKDTAEFVEIFDNLFDVFNSRNKSDKLKPLRAAITGDSNHWDFLNNIEDIFKSMMFIPATCFDSSVASQEANNALTSIQRHPPCLNGYLHNIQTIRELWTILNTSYGVPFIRTNYICQDALENEFSNIRRSCGFNDTPNCYQFAAALKYSSVSKCLDATINTNCEPDDLSTVVDPLEEPEEDPLAIDTENCRMRYFQPIAFDKVQSPDKAEMNALVYVIGYAVTKLKHKKCRKRMVLKHDASQILEHHYSFCRVKQYLNANRFNYPNNTAIEIGTILLTAFKEKFFNFFNESRFGLKNRLAEYVDYSDYETFLCTGCFAKFIDCTLNTLIKGQLLKITNKTNKTNRKTKKNGKARRMGIQSKQPGHQKRKIGTRKSPNYKNIQIRAMKQKSYSHDPVTKVKPNEIEVSNNRTELIDCNKIGPSSSSDNNPQPGMKDYKLNEMEKCVTMLENLVSKFPEQKTVHVEQRDCLTLSLDYILSTYDEFKIELRYIFIQYKKYGRYLKKKNEFDKLGGVIQHFERGA